jgi:hypothetical protein
MKRADYIRPYIFTVSITHASLTSGLSVVYDKAPACVTAGGSFIIFNYSTVTDFARLRGLSISQPRWSAT